MTKVSTVEDMPSGGHGCVGISMSSVVFDRSFYNLIAHVSHAQAEAAPWPSPCYAVKKALAKFPPLQHVR